MVGNHIVSVAPFGVVDCPMLRLLFAALVAVPMLRLLLGGSPARGDVVVQGSAMRIPDAPARPVSLNDVLDALPYVTESACACSCCLGKLRSRYRKHVNLNVNVLAVNFSRAPPPLSG